MHAVHDSRSDGSNLKRLDRSRHRRRAVLRLFGRVLAVALVMTAVACTPLDRLSARYVDGALQFASCHTVEANLLEVAVRSESDRTEIEPVWLVEGDILVRPGDVFTLGEDVKGLITVVDGVVPSSAGEVYFSVGTRDEDGEFGDLRSARFFLADIRDGEWTRSNGSRGEEPCEQ